MDIHIKNIKTVAGGGVNVVENKKSIAKRDKKFFFALVQSLSEVDERSQALLDLGLNLIEYEDIYFNIIENLIIKTYGPLKGGIILWWCGERKLLDTKSYNLIDDEGKGTLISNLNQLYNFLNKLK